MTAQLLCRNLGTLVTLAEGETRAAADEHERAVGATLLERVQDAIRDRATEPSLTVRDISVQVGVSERTLHRALADTGHGFASLLSRNRIRVAKRMLESQVFGCLSIGEIGRRAGFADPSYFGRAIARALGHTPKAYREMHRP